LLHPNTTSLAADAGSAHHLLLFLWVHFICFSLYLLSPKVEINKYKSGNSLVLRSYSHKINIIVSFSNGGSAQGLLICVCTLQQTVALLLFTKERKPIGAYHSKQQVLLRRFILSLYTQTTHTSCSFMSD
jgi:hypothetical protein